MKKVISIVSLFAFPVLVLAETVTSANSLFILVKDILSAILPIIISIAVIYFVYNALMYMIAADEDRKGEAKSKMIYGLIGLFVMVSVWGLVGVLSGTFDLSKTTPPTPELPTIPSF